MGMKRNFIWAGLCVLLAALLLICDNFYEKRNESVFALGEEKAIYLTFDDGPTDSSTPYILDILKEEDVKATFFIIGRQARTRAEILKRTIREGHALAIHSYSHEYNKIYASPQALLDDIEKCRKTIYDITGISPTLYRFPGGSFTVSEELKNCVKKAGYHYVDWNASCRDAELIDAQAEELYQCAISTAADRNYIVMLCHDFAHRKGTVQALPKIIRYYKDKGYTFKTLK